MKRALKDACRRCGGQVWYIYKSGRRCVACAHGRAMIGRAEVRRLEAEVIRLRAQVAALGGGA